MKFQLGGYSLLHIAVGHLSTHSPNMAELLLQFGADPNSGGKRPYQQNASCYVLTDEGEEEEEEEEEEGEGELEQRRVLTAVRNEGDSKITPLHMLCGVTLPKSEDERGEVSPILLQWWLTHHCVLNKPMIKSTNY